MANPKFTPLIASKYQILKNFLDTNFTTENHKSDFLFSQPAQDTLSYFIKDNTCTPDYFKFVICAEYEFYLMAPAQQEAFLELPKAKQLEFFSEKFLKSKAAENQRHFQF